MKVEAPTHAALKLLLDSAEDGTMGRSKTILINLPKEITQITVLLLYSQNQLLY